jgi:hypothetical protein
MAELIFEVTQEADGGYCAECLTHDIFTQADTWDALRPTSAKPSAPIFSQYTEAMELHLAPELQAEVDRLLTETGCSPEQLVEDALAIYFAEAAAMRETLDSRYDDLKSGKVKAIPGDEVRARLREKSAARRSTPVS